MEIASWVRAFRRSCQNAMALRYRVPFGLILRSCVSLSTSMLISSAILSSPVSCRSLLFPLFGIPLISSNVVLRAFTALERGTGGPCAGRSGASGGGSASGTGSTNVAALARPGRAQARSGPASRDVLALALSLSLSGVVPGGSSRPCAPGPSWVLPSSVSNLPLP